MYKILIIDRCYYSRIGLESGLQQSGSLSTLLFTSLNSLFLAKAHVERWQPHLVLADFTGFQQDPQQTWFLPALIRACEQRSILVHLSTGSVSTERVWSKTLPLEAIKQRMIRTLNNNANINPLRIVTPLLTRQEEKVQSLWLTGYSNQDIASEMKISEKTVYTYKRNIRQKLNVENRFSPFISTL